MDLRTVAPSVAVVAVVGLATACGSSSTDSSTASGGSDASGAGSGSASTPAAVTLKTASSPLGTIVVDGSGRSVYVYDKDTKGASSSACTGGCADAWPAVPAPGGRPTGTGIIGTLGSITGVDGTPQATLDGWPLYYYAEDSAAGDVTGQGVGGIWWVVNPSGTKVTAAPTASGSPAPDASGGYAYDAPPGFAAATRQVTPRREDRRADRRREDRGRHGADDGRHHDRHGGRDG